MAATENRLSNELSVCTIANFEQLGKFIQGRQQKPVRPRKQDLTGFSGSQECKGEDYCIALGIKGDW